MRERLTTRYTATLDALERDADFHRFGGNGSFYAWERLGALVERLRVLYDAFELEGDAEPVKAAIDGYLSDLWQRHIKPDQGVNARLFELLGAIEAEHNPWIELHVSAIPMLPKVEWPASMLTVSSDELQAMLNERAAHQGPFPAA
ncbi:hypothetical protein D3C72_1083630 [compost metagenome]